MDRDEVRLQKKTLIFQYYQHQDSDVSGVAAAMQPVSLVDSSITSSSSTTVC